MRCFFLAFDKHMIIAENPVPAQSVAGSRVIQILPENQFSVANRRSLPESSDH
jgi:hypothetical protein